LGATTNGRPVVTATRARKTRAKRRAVDEADPFTGDRVRAVRKAYGLTLPQFAQLLGVALSSAYRWESGDASRAASKRRAGVAPLQRALLRLMERFAAEARKAPPNRRGDAVLGDRFVALVVQPATLHAALEAGDRGELRGLYALLHAVYGSEA
jgi:transcriptional regulator with XRE-family HTH domain